MAGPIGILEIEYCADETSLLQRKRQQPTAIPINRLGNTPPYPTEACLGAAILICSHLIAEC